MSLPLTPEQSAAKIEALEARIAAMEAKMNEQERALLAVVGEVAEVRKLGAELAPALKGLAPMLATNPAAKKIFSFLKGSK